MTSSVGSSTSASSGAPSLVSVSGLNKHYPGFELKDVSFTLEKGTITGFIGRNGAGKSTTLKAMLGLVHPDRGEVGFFGLPFLSDEQAIKKRLAFVPGGIDFYPNKKLKTITSVYRRFYPGWDEDAYQSYMKQFSLDDSKTPAKLSAGMKVKYPLAIALSHHAGLLILDEPTSGLDPVSRDEILDIFLHLVEKEQVTILFSTHITSDLQRCADRILYIRDGALAADDTLEGFLDAWRMVRMTAIPEAAAPFLIGARRERSGWEALAASADIPSLDLSGADIGEATLEDIIIHLERKAP